MTPTRTNAVRCAAPVVLALALASGSALCEDPPADPQAKAAEAERAAAERFTKLDRSGDGSLRGAEAPEGFLARFDRDGDDVITRAEYLEVLRRPERLRRLLPMRDARARAAQALRGFDADKNGSVAREEYPGADHVFRSADRNRDGALSAAELLALAHDELADVRKRMRSPGRTEFLTLFDLDGSNDVTHDEYDGPAASLRKFDTDDDGTVTYAELYPERSERREPEERTAGANAVAQLDKDDDGRVSRTEFPGSDAAWRRLDRNGDGWITVTDGR